MTIPSKEAMEILQQFHDGICDYMPYCDSDYCRQGIQAAARIIDALVEKAKGAYLLEVGAVSSKLAKLMEAKAAAAERKAFRDFIVLHTYRPLDRDPYLDAAQAEAFIRAREGKP